jgi:hypothetical protein
VRRLRRLELSYESALYVGALILIARGLVHFAFASDELQHTCGSTPYLLAVDFWWWVREDGDWLWAAPLAIALMESRWAFRPWVLRSARLGAIGWLLLVVFPFWLTRFSFAGSIR